MLLECQKEEFEKNRADYESWVQETEIIMQSAEGKQSDGLIFDFVNFKRRNGRGKNSLSKELKKKGIPLPITFVHHCEIPLKWNKSSKDKRFWFVKDKTFGYKFKAATGELFSLDFTRTGMNVYQDSKNYRQVSSYILK